MLDMLLCRQSINNIIFQAKTKSVICKRSVTNCSVSLRWTKNVKDFNLLDFALFEL